jgi:hypothetical protein
LDERLATRLGKRMQKARHERHRSRLISVGTASVW